MNKFVYLLKIWNRILNIKIYSSVSQEYFAVATYIENGLSKAVVHCDRS